MSMLNRFHSTARAAVVCAGGEALSGQRPALDTDDLLLGLAVTRASPVLDHSGITAEQVRAERQSPMPGDVAALALFGIDRAEVIRRAVAASEIDPDDPRLWTLRRSSGWPLRITLAGPPGAIVLTGQSRKAVEVAMWAAGRGHDVGGDHLLWGLLSDQRNASIAVLRRLRVDLNLLWQHLRPSRGRAA
jgi:hypothetical protein